MTHDPLCPLIGNGCFDRTEHALMTETPDWCGDCGETCQCALIANVRADERDQAAHRVTKNALVNMTLIPKEVRMVLGAVRGES